MTLHVGINKSIKTLWSSLHPMHPYILLYLIYIYYKLYIYFPNFSSSRIDQISQTVFRGRCIGASYSLNPNQAGGPNGSQQNKMIIFLQPIVRLTSNKAVNLSLSVYQFWPWRATYWQGSPEISLAGSISVSSKDLDHHPKLILTNFFKVM